MIVEASIEGVREAIAAARRAGKIIGFVPTMGFLHEGHLSLIDLARREGAGFVVVSIFVNPLQFGPTEDLDRYPRDEARDRALLEREGTDLLFFPTRETMLPTTSTTRVSVASVAAPLEGERRPGHFDGVATIVLKLFNIVQPDLAVFGQKDAQQCAVIQRMIRDLDLPVRMVTGPTRREADGLAMSSRNSYLNPAERQLAPRLGQALQAGANAIAGGESDPRRIEKAMVSIAENDPGIEIDYLRVVDPATFESPIDMDRDILLVGAIRIGATRLIDNLPVGREAASGKREPRAVGEVAR
ncbi:MAG TPA: pantoate--beta-alanine ligase [Thermoanaerobaculia bacterium]|nr:pantoate--beta-alanine ligase [Thermoanaerobaculia bacterium]